MLFRSYPSPPSSLTHAHRCIGSRNPTRHSVPNSARLTYLSVYDSSDDASEPASSPSPPSSLTYAHRCIGSRNPIRHSVPNFARLTYLSVYDSRDGAPEPVPYPSPPSSITHAHSIQSYTLLTSTFLTFMCTQVLWCLPCLGRSRVSGVTMDPDIRITILSTRGTQCIRGV